MVWNIGKYDGVGDNTNKSIWNALIKWFNNDVNGVYD